MRFVSGDEGDQIHVNQMYQNQQQQDDGFFITEAPGAQEQRDAIEEENESESPEQQ